MIKQWFNYLWVIVFNLLYKNSAIEPSGKTYKKQLQETIESSEVVSEIVHSNSYTKKNKMELVPVEEKMNQVAESAPSEIGHVYESEINTDEETTSSEVTQDTENLKHKEQTEEYEAKGTAKLVGTSGQTVSSAEAKSKQSESMTEAVEGDRKEEPSKVQPSQPPPENSINDNPSIINGPPIITTTNTFKYKPLPPIKPFELLKPFEPPSGCSIKPFEPLKPFEPPKSFEIAKQISAMAEPTNSEPSIKTTENINALDSLNLKQFESVETMKNNEMEALGTAQEPSSVAVEETPNSFKPTVAEPLQPPSSESLNHYQSSPLDPLEPLNLYEATPYGEPPKSYELFQPTNPPHVSPKPLECYEPPMLQPTMKPFESSIPTQPLNPSPRGFASSPKPFESAPFLNSYPEEPSKCYEPLMLQPTMKPFESSVHSQPLNQSPRGFASSPKPFESAPFLNSYPEEPSKCYEPQMFQPTMKPFESSVHSQPLNPSPRGFVSSPKPFESAPLLNSYREEPSYSYQPQFVQPTIKPFDSSVASQPLNPRRFGPSPKPFESPSYREESSNTSFQPTIKPLNSYQSVNPPQSSRGFSSSPRPFESIPSSNLYQPTLKPFEPITQSEPIQAYNYQTLETQKPFQTTISQGGAKPFQLDSGKPLDSWKPMYQPVDPFVPPLQTYQTPSSKAEIKEEKIKNTLKEIISEIDVYAEKDKELKDSFEAGKMNGIESNYSYEKVMENSFGTAKQDTTPPGDTWVARLPSCVPPKPRPLSLPPDNLMNIMKDIQFTEETSESYHNTYGGDSTFNMSILAQKLKIEEHKQAIREGIITMVVGTIRGRKHPLDISSNVRDFSSFGNPFCNFSLQQGSNRFSSISFSGYL